MKVSIVTPSYNRENFIEATIQSVLSQTYPDIEYFVIDGNSSDGTIEILEKYKESGKLRYLSEPDNGMYDAINKGLRMATGDVLAYLNADDRYFPWTVEVAVQAFQDNPDSGIIYGDTMVMDPKEADTWLGFYPKFSSTWLRCGGFLAQPTVFFRRGVYDHLGDFQKKVKLIADVEYWLRAVNENIQITKINEILAIECNHEQTLRQTRRSEIEEERVLLLKTYTCRFGFTSILKTLYKRLKYLEKEAMTIQFMLKTLMHHRGKFWREFLSAYRVKCNFLHFITNKIFRSKKHVWRVTPKHGMNVWRDHESY